MRSLVIAPHPDDETLGCGGTLLRRQAEGGAIGWLIVTGISTQAGWPIDRVRQRATEIQRVTELYKFDEVFELNLAAAELDGVPVGDLVGKIASAIKKFEPTEVFLPHRGDVHTDHRIVFDAAVACTKWFRYPCVQRILSYETVSETDFGLDAASAFHPNYFVDISSFLEKKLQILSVYASELGEFPFPRSLTALKALAAVRGATSGFSAAEAFQLLRARQ